MKIAIIITVCVLIYILYIISIKMIIDREDDKKKPSKVKEVLFEIYAIPSIPALLIGILVKKTIQLFKSDAKIEK